jgi:hypothetical protein
LGIDILGLRFEYDVEKYSPNAPVLPVGKDEMSPGAIRKWPRTISAIN